MTEREIFIGSVGPHLYEDTDDLYDPLDTDDSGVFDGISGTPGILTNGSVVAGSLALFDTNASNILSLIWNEDDTVDRVLNLLVGGASRSVTLNEDFIVGDGYNVTITALGQANTLTLNEGFTIGDGYPGTLTFGSACVLTVEATSLINQDLTTDSIVATLGRLLINSAASPPSQLKIQGNSLGVISALVYGADNCAIGFDADYNAAWYARATEAALIYKTGGYLKIYGDDSLTPGNTFTPTALIDIGLATGDFDIKLHDAATVGLKLGGTLLTPSPTEFNQLDGNIFVTDVSVPTELGSELAPALTGASGVNWTFGAGWTTPLDGTLDKASDGTGTMTPTAASSIVAGRTYKVVITASALIVGSCRVKLGNVDLIPITAATTYTQYITASTTANLILTPYTSTSRFTISAVSVKELDNTLGNLDIDGDLTVKSRILNASGVQVANLSPTTRAGYGWNGITFFGNTTFKNGYSFFRGGIQVAGSPIILMDSNDLYENYLWVNNTAAYWLTNESNRQIIIHDRIIGFGKNFDHSAQANPTLFIHSITNPDTSNFEWGSLAFVGTGSGGGYFKLATGVGDISLSPVGNLLLGSVTSPATMVNGVGWASGTAPTADVADQISIHVEDIAAGHAALHIRNENSTIVKLYQQAHITDAPGDTAANNATTINAILTALENNGLLASA